MEVIFEKLQHISEIYGYEIFVDKEEIFLEKSYSNFEEWNQKLFISIKHDDDLFKIRKIFSCQKKFYFDTIIEKLAICTSDMRDYLSKDIRTYRLNKKDGIIIRNMVEEFKDKYFIIPHLSDRRSILSNIEGLIGIKFEINDCDALETPPRIGNSYSLRIISYDDIILTVEVLDIENFSFDYEKISNVYNFIVYLIEEEI